MGDYDTEAIELRLFMEDLCCDVCRFDHLEQGMAPGDIRIRQDVNMGLPNCFADIQITVPGQPSYFVEVKMDRDAGDVIDRIARKFARLTPASEHAGKVIVVTGDPECGDATFEAGLRSGIHPNLGLELWPLQVLRDKLRHHFQQEISGFERDELIRMRAAVERTKGAFAFGEQYTGSSVEAMLMWHFGCWTIRCAREAAAGRSGAIADTVVHTGLYHDVAVLVVNLSGFSAYVRDTRDDSVVQTALTAFYTKARRAVINCGGMLSQFVGDSVIAAFGVPTCSPGYIDQALQCALAIMDIGKSVSQKWQKHIDRLQPVQGCHAGIALGDMLVVPYRAYSRSHLGIVADAVNMAARLSTAARTGEIVVSNAFHQRASRACRRHFTEMEPVEAKNVGRLQAWKWDVESVRAAAAAAQ